MTMAYLGCILCLFLYVNLKNLLFIICQDTVVLRKNVQHSFGRAQDRVSPPTRKNNSNKLETKTQERHARKQPWTRERARKRKQTRPQALKWRNKRLNSKDVN